jgi:transposase
MAVAPLGQLLALQVTVADVQERTQGAELAAQVQAVTGESVEGACVDQGDTGDQPVPAAAAHGLHREVVKLPEAKRGVVLLPRRWGGERSFAWTARFRRLARDYERLPKTLAGVHFLAFAILLLKRFVEWMT